MNNRSQLNMKEIVELMEGVHFTAHDWEAIKSILQLFSHERYRDVLQELLPRTSQRSLLFWRIIHSGALAW